MHELHLNPACSAGNSPHPDSSGEQVREVLPDSLIPAVVAPAFSRLSDATQCTSVSCFERQLNQLSSYFHAFGEDRRFSILRT